MCRMTYYTLFMIVSIRYKGLQRFYEDGDAAKLPAQYRRKIHRILDQLDAVTSLQDSRQMGAGVHKLTGELSEFWAVSLTPNFRLIFRFVEPDVHDVDYVDYH